jgi:predicted DNA-binding transcriptional regulator AlpA
MIITPRLLSAAETAEKLGCSRSTFYRQRQVLEGMGFPPPVLEEDALGGARWDAKAIDLWLDNRMPMALRRKIKISRDLDQTHIAIKLQQRAQELAV